MHRFEKIVVDPNNLPRQIAERLREQMLLGQLRPGDRLPAERELAASLNVSRSALREAARLLESAGLLVVRRGRGTFVAMADLDHHFAETMAPSPAQLVAPGELADLYQVRRLLEPVAASWAAESIKAKDAKRLLALCEESEALLHGASVIDFDRLADIHRDVHGTIIQACGNPILVRITEALMDLLTESRRYSIRRSGRAEKTLREHRSLVDAIVHGQSRRAHRLMLEHIASIEKSSLDVRRSRAKKLEGKR